MAFAAMTGPLDEIGAAIHLMALGWIGYEGSAVEIEPLPQAKACAQIVREGYLVRRCRRRCWDQRVKKRLQIHEVVARHVPIGSVGKGRIIMPARGRHTLGHGS